MCVCAISHARRGVGCVRWTACVCGESYVCDKSFAMRRSVGEVGSVLVGRMVVINHARRGVACVRWAVCVWCRVCVIACD